MLTAHSFLVGSVLILIFGIICHAAVLYTLAVFISGLDSDARYHRVNDNHFSDVSHIAGLISVDKRSMLFPDVFELDTLFVVVFSGIIKNKLIMISVHSSEFA